MMRRPPVALKKNQVSFGTRLNIKILNLDFVLLIN